MRSVPSLRAGAAVAMAESYIHLSPPAATFTPAAPPPSCDAVKCPWWPYSSATDFKANTALILAVLFGALICILGFSAVVSYLIRRHCCGRRRTQDGGKEEPEGNGGEQAAEVPSVVYAEGMSLAGEETECIICLSDFAAGDKIRVLDKCSHGFHLQCIQRWLAARDSCPTCRASCSDDLESTPP